MKAQVCIVHGWDGYPEEGWFPWLKTELEMRGFEILVPQMPHADAPDIDTWTSHLSNVIGVPNEHTFFVGHSIGCQAIMRYLEQLPPKVRVGGIVCVAGFFTLTNMEDEETKEIARPWLTLPIDYEKVLSHTHRMTAIFSDNDQYVPLENITLFEEHLHPKIIVLKKHGHFSGSQGIKKLPAVLEELMALHSD